MILHDRRIDNELPPLDALLPTKRKYFRNFHVTALIHIDLNNSEVVGKNRKREREDNRRRFIGLKGENWRESGWEEKLAELQTGWERTKFANL